jgi:hypothetical protein
LGPGFTKKTMRCDGNRTGLPDFFRFEGVRPQRKHAPSVIEWRGSHSSGPATVFTDLALYKGTVRPQEGPGRFADIGEGPDWVTSVVLCNRRWPVDFRYAPFVTEVVRRYNMSRRANCGLMHRSKTRRSIANASMTDQCFGAPGKGEATPRKTRSVGDRRHRLPSC